MNPFCYKWYLAHAYFSLERLYVLDPPPPHPPRRKRSSQLVAKRRTEKLDPDLVHGSCLGDFCGCDQLYRSSCRFSRG